MLALVVLLCAAPATADVGKRIGAGAKNEVVVAAETSPVEVDAASARRAAKYAEPVPDAPRYPSVVARRPAVRVGPVDDVRVVGRVRAVPGVAAATALHIGRSPVGRDGADGTLTVAAVDPVEYRPFAPPVSADAVGLWQRLDEGAIAVMHEHAHRLGVELGGTVLLGGVHEVAVRVGAIASNGTPPVAEAIVDRRTGARLGLDTVAPTILVAVDDDADAAAVARELERTLALPAEVIPDPRQARPVTPMPPRGDTVWDQLAICESSGDWAANTGNGFYGGLQFLPESWWLVGGQGMPHEAPREEQIARAERLLALQGWEAWPVCSVKLGLRPPPG